MNKYLNYFLCMFTAVTSLSPNTGKRIRPQSCSLMRFQILCLPRVFARIQKPGLSREAGMSLFTRQLMLK